MKIMKWEKADWDPKVDPGPHGRASSGENFVFRFRRAAPLARPVTLGYLSEHSRVGSSM